MKAIQPFDYFAPTSFDINLNQFPHYDESDTLVVMYSPTIVLISFDGEKVNQGVILETDIGVFDDAFDAAVAAAELGCQIINSATGVYIFDEHGNKVENNDFTLEDLFEFINKTEKM